MKRNKITAVRNLIDSAANKLKNRLHKVTCSDEEVIYGDYIISVEYDVYDDDYYKEIEIVSVDIYNQRGYISKNVTAHVYTILEDEINRMNREAENDYLDTLTKSERKNYYEWLAS